MSNTVIYLYQQPKTSNVVIPGTSVKEFPITDQTDINQLDQQILDEIYEPQNLIGEDQLAFVGEGRGIEYARKLAKMWKVNCLN